MQKEKILISGLLVLVFMGLGLACETPEPPVTPVQNSTACNQSVDVDNTVDVVVDNNNTNITE